MMTRLCNVLQKLKLTGGAGEVISLIFTELPFFFFFFSV